MTRRNRGDRVEMSPQGLPKPRRARLGTCGFCGGPLHGTPRCTRRRCPGYTYLWARDAREVITTNLAAYDGGNRRVILGTLTPSGASLMQWDKRACRGLGPHRCSGDLGCRVKEDDAIAFNRTAARRLATVHRLAAQRVQRSHGCRPVVLARVWEHQKRGLVHPHFALGAGTAIQEATAREYLALMQEVAPKYGFGFADRVVELWPSSDAATYCAKALRETAADPSFSGQIVWVSSALTDRTGCTFRALRHRRFVYATTAGQLPASRTARAWRATPPTAT